MSQRRDCIASLKEASPAVLPSLLLCDFGNLEREIQRLEEAGVAALHLDVMDGVFVPNFSYGMTIVAALRKLTELPLDVHLMMVNPEKYIQQFYDAGADIITIHAEATEDAPAILKKIRELGAASGIAINPDTPVTKIAGAIEYADLVLAMSVHAGFGGQSFIESVLSKFDEIRSLPGGQDVILEIDGGINIDTIGLAAEKGAELLVAGSAVFKQDDYATAMENLMSQVKCLKMNIFGNPSNLNFLLVRAGSTDLDDQGRIVGSLDMPLSPTGEGEAKETADALTNYDIDAIYSAACLSAQQTAQQLSRDGEIRVRVQENWVNLDHGLWHGKSLDELKENQPKLYRQWHENPESVCPPGGETIEEVRLRVKAVLKKICRKFRSGTVAIVAPDPLISIIRSEIDDSEVRDLIPTNEPAIRWEEIEFRAVEA